MLWRIDDLLLVGPDNVLAMGSDFGDAALKMLLRGHSPFIAWSTMIFLAMDKSLAERL